MRLVVFLFCCFLSCQVAAVIPRDSFLEEHNTNLSDIASLQSGAQTYMQYCLGCHSLKYIRYSRIATDLRLPANSLLEYAPRQEVGIQGADFVISSMSAEGSSRLFGAESPDLSLSERQRGADWLYTYLRVFYEDPSRPMGVNNWIYPNVAMPNVLSGLQGQQVLVNSGLSEGQSHTLLEEKADVLYIAQPGELSEAEFNELVFDLVNFLAYVADPTAVQREKLGWKVLAYLCILLVFVYLLKKELWQHIK